MSLWIERKYITLISHRIPRFKTKSQNLFNGRCPICGDSKTNLKKMRFFIYVKETKFVCHCHNCGLHQDFRNFLKRLDESLYQDFNQELLEEKVQPQIDLSTFKTETRVSAKDAWSKLIKLKKISQLSHLHPAKKYVESRHIPNPLHAEFRFTEQFAHWINEIVPGKYDDDALKIDESRLVIPFFDKGHYLFGVQGRAISPLTKQRYLSILFDENKPLIWGLDRIDHEKPIYAFEGVLDAIFVSNSVAICGANYPSLLKVIKSPILVYDNEPNSRETKKKITKAIEQGLSVVIWPDNLIHKDVDNMIVGGYSIDHVLHIMKENTFDGMAARFRLEEWSKR